MAKAPAFRIISAIELQEAGRTVSDHCVFQGIAEIDGQNRQVIAFGKTAEALAALAPPPQAQPKHEEEEEENASMDVPSRASDVLSVLRSAFSKEMRSSTCDFMRSLADDIASGAAGGKEYMDEAERTSGPQAEQNAWTLMAFETYATCLGVMPPPGSGSSDDRRLTQDDMPLSAEIAAVAAMAIRSEALSGCALAGSLLAEAKEMEVFAEARRHQLPEWMR